MVWGARHAGARRDSQRRRDATASGSRVRRKKGLISRLYAAPPEQSVIVCLDEMGPLSARSDPGRQLLRLYDPRGAPVRPTPRATQEVDYGRRGYGYLFGAFRPATGEALTAPYDGRTIANGVDFLERVERWLPADVERVYALLDNLSSHKATDVMLFNLAYPRWEFVFLPKAAAYLNLIEPWWKVLRSLALKGQRFETWEEVCQAVDEATRYWNAHRHPLIWG